MNRRGVSPVIATVLLVLVALIIASIIFVWAKNFVGEKAQKNQEPLEVSCEKISFEAEGFANENNLYLVNRGNIPIYGVEMRKKGIGSEITVGLFEDKTIGNGETGVIDLSKQGLSINTGDDFIIIPIVLGENGKDTQAYTCDVSEKSETITIQ